MLRLTRWHFKPYVKHMPLTYAIGDANATPRSARAKNKVLRVFDIADCVKVLHVRVFACLGFGIIRCSADASVAYFNKHRLVGLSGPVIPAAKKHPKSAPFCGAPSSLTSRHTTTGEKAGADSAPNSPALMGSAAQPAKQWQLAPAGCACGRHT